MVMVMNRILMVIVLIGSMVMISCTNQSPPIPTSVLPPTATVVAPTPIPMAVPTIAVLPRPMVMESLTRFNDTNNNFIRFLSVNGDIYQLEGESMYHVSYIASKQIMLGLAVYKDAINNWTPPNNNYHDRLMEIKEAELYRIEHFGGLTELMMMTLPSENEEAIQVVRDQFEEWRDDKRNLEPMNLQNSILKELNINSDDVNFLYVIPEIDDKATPPPSLPPMPFDDKRPGENS